MMPRTLLTLTILGSLLVSGCGGSSPGAAALDGALEVRARDGAVSRTTGGLFPFGNGDAVDATDGGGTVRVVCGGEIGETSAAANRPAAGLADVTLGPGTRFGRRSGPFFDLFHGTIDVDTGPMKTRVVVYRGLTFIEVQPTNAEGVAFSATADGEQLRVSVSRGEVLVHSPGRSQGELHFVTLGPNESAVAVAGSKPVKKFADD